MIPPCDLKFTLTVVRTACVHYFFGHSPQPQEQSRIVRQPNTLSLF
jgi:hypothetical protein